MLLMVIVVPLSVSERLSELERQYCLDLPVPLSSSWASYFAPEQLDPIFAALRPLLPESADVAQLWVDLETYRQEGEWPLSCQA